MTEDDEADDSPDAGTPVNVHRVVLCVVDHDRIGEWLKDMIEDARYPNRCIAPTVMSIETRTVDWTDEHPLNIRSTHAAAFADLFGLNNLEHK